jgi:hypothetical protein
MKIRKSDRFRDEQGAIFKVLCVSESWVWLRYPAQIPISRTLKHVEGCERVI